MENITRKEFIKNTVALGALAILSPLSSELFAKEKSGVDEELMQKLIMANDKLVEKLVVELGSEITVLRRGLGYDFAYLSSSYCTKGSAYFQKEELPPLMIKILNFLSKTQAEDGTLDLGNLGSPPDTAFILEPICAATSILHKNKSKELNEVKETVKNFIVKAGVGLTEGGVHTPNHRWVVSAALSRIHSLYPNQKYVDRINDWLGEKVYNDSEGHYLERSVIYSEVIDRCLITIARLMNKPELLEPVRKNLKMTYYYMEPNGEVVSVESRRQDQFMIKNILEYYHHYRYLAIKENNSEFAGIARFIEGVKGFEEDVIGHSLFHFLEEPLLKRALPKASPLETDFEKLFTKTNLARIRRNNTTTTIFGGNDWPLIIASGRSTNPNFFSFRKGDAILRYMRLSNGFFNTGYFRSEGLKKEGNQYILHKKLEAPYYQPLPQNLRKEDGDYQLSESTDGRFWNKMDFEDRKISNVKTLDTTITVEERNGTNEVTFKISGADNVPVTIELCFGEGGKLTGVTDAEGGNFILEKGEGEYQMGKDSVKFGPGIMKHKKITGLDGEMYSSHFGSLRTEGMHVYLTGKTPFEHTIRFS
jgi:hypothetical protein